MSVQERAKQLKRTAGTNLPYKTLSVLIALALWFIVRDQRIEDTVRFQLDIEPAEGLVVGDESLPELTVRALGTRATLERLQRTARTHVVKVDKREPGSVTVRVSPDDLVMPPGVEAFDVMPRSTVVRLEHRLVRKLPVRPRLVIAAGFRAKRVAVTPSHVRVAGPASVVDSLDEVWTEAVDIAASREAVAAIALTHPQLEVEDKPSVRIAVELEAAPTPTPEDGL